MDDANGEMGDRRSTEWWMRVCGKVEETKYIQHIKTYFKQDAERAQICPEFTW